jgi:hypothetical protein
VGVGCGVGNGPGLVWTILPSSHSRPLVRVVQRRTHCAARTALRTALLHTAHTPRTLTLHCTHCATLRHTALHTALLAEFSANLSLSLPHSLCFLLSSPCALIMIYPACCCPPLPSPSAPLCATLPLLMMPMLMMCLVAWSRDHSRRDSMGG